MKITIVAFGKLKTPGINDAVSYYARNLSAWAQTNEIELKALSIPDKSAATRKKIQNQEEHALFDKIQKLQSSRTAVILLDEKGKSIPTLEWSKQIEKLKNNGFTELFFCVGGSLGFSEEARKKAKLVLSLGPQTLSHEIARLVLTEQIYRAMSLLNGHPYHHEG